MDSKNKVSQYINTRLQKVFKPLILFHDQASTAPAQIVEEHRIKTQEMMDRNALLWEREGPYCLNSSDLSPKQQQLTPHSNRSSYSSNEYQFNDQRQANNSFFSTSHSAMDILEPRTQTSIPPLYNNQPQETTFIAEPQFHPTYRPNISRKRRRGNLPKEVTEFLKRWLLLHKKHPYPTEREKQKLADETGLMVNQISNWFINARRRILQPLLESESQHEEPSLRSSRSSSSGTQQQMMEQSNEPYNRSIEPLFPGDEPSSSVPPPWVLLPTKLPSMNILDKDLDAFKAE